METSNGLNGADFFGPRRQRCPPVLMVRSMSCIKETVDRPPILPRRSSDDAIYNWSQHREQHGWGICKPSTEDASARRKEIVQHETLNSRKNKKKTKSGTSTQLSMMNATSTILQPGANRWMSTVRSASTKHAGDAQTEVKSQRLGKLRVRWNDMTDCPLLANTDDQSKLMPTVG